MARILRGDVYWADLDPVRGSEQAGRRPVLVIQANEINARSSTTIVLAITSQPQRAGYPLTVHLDKGEGGLRREGWIKTTQVRTLSLERFGRRAGRLGNGRLREVADALVDVLAI